MKLSRIFFLLLITMFASVNAADPSVDGAMTGFQFLEEPTSPELIGLASSGVASAGMGGFFYNPAKYSLVASPSFHLEFGRYKKADANKVNFELSIPIKKAFISYGMRVFSVDDIGSVDNFGNLPQGSFSERALKLSLSTGLEINKYLNIGLSASGAIHHIYTDNAYGLLFGVGVISSPIPEKLNVGLSVVDLGFTTGMYAKVEKLGEGEKLPVNSRLGVEWKDTLKTIDYRVLFDIVYRNVWDRDDDFSHRISDRFTFPVGLEVRPVTPLAIRLGKRINFPTEIINMGMGLNTTFIDFDFGLVVNSLSGDGEADWTASFTYHLVKNKKSKVKSEELLNKKKPAEIKGEVKDSIINTSVDTVVQDSSDINIETSVIDSNSNKDEVESLDMSVDSLGESLDMLIDSIEEVQHLEEEAIIPNKTEDIDSDSTRVEINEERIILKNEENVEDSTSMIINDSTEVLMSDTSTIENIPVNDEVDTPVSSDSTGN